MKPVSGKRLAQILTRRGWYLVRVKSSHHSYAFPGRPDHIVIPIRGNKDLRPGLQHALMKQAGLTEADL